jgi:cytochrome c
MMDLIGLNKIAGGVLVAALFAVAAKMAAQAVYRAAPPEYPAYIVEGADELADRSAPLVPPENSEPNFARAIPAANADHGETVAAPCAICHNWMEGGANLVGPNLFDIIEREKASVPDFNYSPALQSLGGVWTYADLNAFLEQPSAFAPGTIMGFAGITGQQDRFDLIAFMRNWSLDPAPLPQPDAAPAP